MNLINTKDDSKLPDLAYYSDSSDKEDDEGDTSMGGTKIAMGPTPLVAGQPHAQVHATSERPL